MKNCDIKIFLLSIFIKTIISHFLFDIMILFFDNNKRDRRLINNVFNIITINIKFYFIFIRDSIMCFIARNII